MRDQEKGFSPGAENLVKAKEDPETERGEVHGEVGSPAIEMSRVATAQGCGEATAVGEDIDTYRREAEEYKDRWLRAAAELDNYRKRVTRETEEMIRRGNESVLREMIVVMDNLERAFNHANEYQNTESIVEGINRIIDQFSSALKKCGVQPIHTKGEQFDPQVHEAVLQVQSSEVPSGTIVEEWEKGYMINDRLLRPAKVSVSKLPE